MILTDGPTEVLELCGPRTASRRKQKLGVIKITVSSPFPENEVVRLLRGCKVVTVLDTLDAASFGQGQLATAVRTALHKAIENGAERIVMGRPIIKARPNDKGLPQNPREAVERTLKEIQAGLLGRRID